MGCLLKQSSAARPLLFLMLDDTDHVTGKTGLSPTVTLRKVGGSFASPAGAVTEIANGWYQVAGNATDTNTLGPLILHATGTDADPCDDVFDVVAFDPDNAVRLGLTALPNAAADAAGGLPVSDAGGLDLDARLDAAVSSRMATYAQPTGFLAATFPSDPADQSLVIAATDALAALIGDVPTNAELATALGTADDATLAAIAALNNLSSAQAQTAAAAALAAYDPPTHAEVTAATGAVPAAVLAAGDVDGFTLEQTLKLCLAALAGKLSGAATTTITIRSADDSANRIVATVDESGNRSSVTLNAAG